MKPIKVNLHACYGYSCCGCGIGSEDSIDLMVSNKAYDTLSRIKAEEISETEVGKAISAGHRELERMDRQITDAFYEMVDEYWLFEETNPDEEVVLDSNLDEDISSGEFTPAMTEEQFRNYWDEHQAFPPEYTTDYFSPWGEDIDDYDDVDSFIADQYHYYLLNAYREWVYDQDHYTIALKTGLDLDACHDMPVEYTIELLKD